MWHFPSCCTHVSRIVPSSVRRLSSTLPPTGSITLLIVCSILVAVYEASIMPCCHTYAQNRGFGYGEEDRDPLSQGALELTTPVRLCVRAPARPREAATWSPPPGRGP
jgi:hypothetical protein